MNDSRHLAFFQSQVERKLQHCVLGQGKGINFHEDKAGQMQYCSEDNDKACRDMSFPQSRTPTVPCNVKFLLHLMELTFHFLTKIWSIFCASVSYCITISCNCYVVFLSLVPWYCTNSIPGLYYFHHLLLYGIKEEAGRGVRMCNW